MAAKATARVPWWYSRPCTCSRPCGTCSVSSQHTRTGSLSSMLMLRAKQSDRVANRTLHGAQPGKVAAQPRQPVLYAHAAGQAAWARNPLYNFAPCRGSVSNPISPGPPRRSSGYQGGMSGRYTIPQDKIADLLLQPPMGISHRYCSQPHEGVTRHTAAEEQRIRIARLNRSLQSWGRYGID
jgi:hypothetical protein